MATTTAQHTPGPWEVSDAPGKTRVLGYDGISVCGIRDRGSQRLSHANASLIAAAPDLLDLAEAIVTAYGDLITSSPIERHLLDGARRAIAKARGEG